MEAKSSERRYNTRFRGVPRSVFTYSRKKSSTKSNNESDLRTDIRDDFVYTKLGKKPQHESTSPPKSKFKTQSLPSVNKHEKKSPKNEAKTNSLPNGTHKHTQEDMQDLPLNLKEESPTENSTSNKTNQVPQFETEEATDLTLQKGPPQKKSRTDSNEVPTVKADKASVLKNNNTLNNNRNPLLEPNKDLLENAKISSPPFKTGKSQHNKADKTLPPFNINNFHNFKKDKSPPGNPKHKPQILDGFDVTKVEASSPESSPKFEKDMDGIFFEPKIPEDLYGASNSNIKSQWIDSKEKLSWNNCTVASYNPKTKMFRCAVCHAVGFMSRIGEHYLGTHCNAKVFHCPQCSYCSAWWRCVRNHMSKNHGVSNAPASMWKNQPLLDEIMQLLQNLKYSVDCEDRVEKIAENCGKRYICPKCPYATDRRDLYNRHENIHREEKPFQCYICYKLFNRADHVKKHFCRIHKEFSYDINLIRRLPSKRSRIPVSPSLNQDICTNGSSSGGGIVALHEINPFNDMPKPPLTGPVSQSQLMTCLTGSPTLVRMAREIDNNTAELSPPPENDKDSFLNKEPFYSSKEPFLNGSKNDNTFNKFHSNLLTYLTQNAFSPKPIHHKPKNHHDPPLNNHHSPPILHEALLKPAYNQFPVSGSPKKFSCPCCPWTGPNAWALRIHSSMHYKTFCVLCNFKSKEATVLESHMWDCHKKRSCNKCNFLADSLLELDAHLKEAHCQKPQFSCRHCSQSFELRSDMEAHCIFIHNQVLQECKDKGCDFCTTDPEILDVHKKEIHTSTPATSKDASSSASRTQCLYCGCDFADPQSLQLHEQLFHENSLMVAGRRPMNPYGCSVCGYSTPRQPMMMEHMRVHSGQVLRCQAGLGCAFTTPYDTVLKEHVKGSHGSDDGTVRCPHCGLPCGTRESFV
ncbi:hypothetical protein JTE90_008752, partial [Oedothorax gibbosus]